MRLKSVLLGAIGYRYFRGPSVSPFFDGKHGTIVPIKIQDANQSVEISLTIGID